MSLLLDVRQPDWMEEADLAALLAPDLPGVRIRVGIEDGPLEDVTMMAVVTLHPGAIGALPNLRLVQKLGVGVEGILRDPDLRPDIRVARLAPDASSGEIAAYFLAHVLGHQCNMAAFRGAQAEAQWAPLAPRESAKTVVGVLGLGNIGARTARSFAALGFRVVGWSRSPKQMEGVTSVSGPDGLVEVLSTADYVACILPSTAETRGLLGAGMLRRMKPGGVLLNAGRGDLIDEEALIAALDAGHLAHAVLDVFRREPLPRDHPFWRHPRVTVTPHSSGWHLGEALGDVAENYRRLMAGQPLLREIDRVTGY
ncbi:MAG: glyoxylate/hydroxypyruvate reductase A [Pseudomonadota bacterium]